MVDSVFQPGLPSFLAGRGFSLEGFLRRSVVCQESLPPLLRCVQRSLLLAPLAVFYTMSKPRSPAPGSPALAPSSGIPYGHVPAYLPGAASLVEQLDETILVVLRDGRHIVGVRTSGNECELYVTLAIHALTPTTHFP